MRDHHLHLDDQQTKQAMGLTSQLSDTFDEKETEVFLNAHTHKKWYHDFRLLFEMIRDKKYAIDRSDYLVIAGALAYVVLPIDIIPDILPGVGFLDDAFVIAMVIEQLSDEIARYKAS